MEEKQMYYSFAKGNKGRWIFPVEAEPSVAKAMQNDGLQIIPLENFVPTDSKKMYCIKAKGSTKEWLLSVPLEPEVAQEFRNGGVEIEETFNTADYELVDGKFEEKVEEVVEEPVKKQRKSKGKVAE